MSQTSPTSNSRRSSYQSAQTNQRPPSSRTLLDTRIEQSEASGRASTLDPTNETPEITVPTLPVPRLPVEASTSSENDQREEWSRKTVLTLDGGGIKGFSSLLILRDLMLAISRIERAENPPSPNSVFPLDYRRPIRHKRIQTVRQRSTFSLQGGEPKHERVSTPLEPTSDYLPCHYFDYIAGSSTGGLIAIMLGRLGMTVDECLAKYENLAHRVFKHPRIFQIRNLIWPLPKYDEKLLEGIIKEIVYEYSGLTESNYPQKYDRMCRTIVIAYQERTISTTRKPYLFRSYAQPAPDKSDDLHRKQIFDKDNFPIWKIARATSAAPTYFKSVKLVENDDKFTFIDGGWGCNNPTEEVYRSIKQLRGNDRKATSIIVSIGTGKPAEASDEQKPYNPFSFEYYFRYAISGALQATDSERIHENFIDTARDLFPYYRLNVERNLGDLKLDAFEGRFGRKTLTEIADATTVWLASSEARELTEASAQELVRIRRKRALHQAPLSPGMSTGMGPRPPANNGQSQADVAEKWQDRLYRWERFVHGVEYQCTQPEICKSSHDRFWNRHELREHLAKRHHFDPNGEDVEVALDASRKHRLFDLST